MAHIQDAVFLVFPKVTFSDSRAFVEQEIACNMHDVFQIEFWILIWWIRKRVVL